MGQVSLRQYLKQVEGLIDEGKQDEALAHVRHILTQYPKNAAAYRALGRVLVAQSKWEEAGDVLRRALAVLPTDFVAHEQLSLVYENQGKLDEALYHIERAFDQQPNDKDVIARLRRLYTKQRGVNVEKLQLTAGAVANQYIANNNPQPAIDLLRKTLQRSPERVDLRLSLARALWLAEERVDAAETAMDVLKVLPYALIANRILAELWLAEGRPSDAQRYLSRIEEVEPYLALQLATGSAPDDGCTIEELDYQRLLKQQLSTANPDWLAQLSDAPAAQDDALPLLDDQPNLVNETFKGDLPDDVLRRIESLRGTATDETVVVKQPAGKTGLTGLFDDIVSDDTADDLSWLEDLADADSQTAPAKSGRVSTGLTGMLSALQDDSPVEVDDSWLNDLNDFDDIFSPASAQTAQDSKPDFLADIPDAAPQHPQSGRVPTGLTGYFSEESGDFDAVLDDTPRGDVLEEEDPLAWMQQTTASAVDPNDPLAWMKDSGIEYDENAVNPYEAQLDLDEADMFTPQDEDPLAWMKEAGIEFNDEPAEDTPAAQASGWSLDDEAFDLEEMMALDALTTDEQATVAQDWQRDMLNDDDELSGWDAEEEDDLAWLSDPEVLANAQTEDALQAEEGIPSDLDWMLDSSAEDFTWQTELEDETSAPDLFGDLEIEEQPAADANSFGFSTSELQDFAPADETPDWMSEFATDEPQAQAVADDFAFGDDETPDWMSEFATEEPQAQAVADDFAFGDDETPDWMSEFATDEAGDDFAFAEESVAVASAALPMLDDELVDTAPASNAPDWLNAMVPGVDVSDAPIDTESLADEQVETLATQRKRGEFSAVNEGFDWLLDIVAQEEQHVAPAGAPAAPPPLRSLAAASAPATVPSAPTPAPVAVPPPLPFGDDVPELKPLRRFVFSKLPKWIEASKTQDKSDDFDIDDDFDFDDDFTK